MRTFTLDRLPRSRVISVLEIVPFFRSLMKNDPRQLNALLPFIRLIEAEPGEIVIRKGEFDATVYFVLEGMLQVTIYQEGMKKTLGHITPGEEVGGLAVIRDMERSATIATAHDAPKHLLLALDTSPFGEINDFSHVSFTSKYNFYWSIVCGVRKRLEAYKLDNPYAESLSKLCRLPTYEGDIGTLEELYYLHQQALALAGILEEWNHNIECEESRLLDRRKPLEEIIEKLTVM